MPARKPSRFTVVQTRKVFKIVRYQRGRQYRYTRLSLEGGALDALGLRAGQTVQIEYRPGEIRIRPSRPAPRKKASRRRKKAK